MAALLMSTSTVPKRSTVMAHARAPSAGSVVPGSVQPDDRGAALEKCVRVRVAHAARRASDHDHPAEHFVGVGWHTLVHVSTTESNPYSQIKTYERRELDRLTPYLEGLNADGWVEQSYCTDWLVYQVVSHIGSGSRIGAARIQGWVGSGTPMSREKMQ